MRNGATLAVESKTESRVPTRSPVIIEKNCKRKDFIRDKKISIQMTINELIFFLKFYSKGSF